MGRLAIQRKPQIVRHVPEYTPPKFLDFTAVNSIRSDSSGSVFANNGALSDDGADNWWVLLHLKHSVLKLDGYYVEYSAHPRAASDIDTNQFLGSMTIDVSYQMVVTDWDPVTVTWDTALTLRNVATLQHDLGVSAAVENTGSQITATQNAQQAEGNYEEIRLNGKDGKKLTTTQIDAGERIFGILINIDSTVYDGTRDATGTVRVNDGTDNATSYSYAIL